MPLVYCNDIFMLRVTVTLFVRNRMSLPRSSPTKTEDNIVLRKNYRNVFNFEYVLQLGFFFFIYYFLKDNFISINVTIIDFFFFFNIVTIIIYIYIYIYLNTIEYITSGIQFVQRNRVDEYIVQTRIFNFLKTTKTTRKILKI